MSFSDLGDRKREREGQLPPLCHSLTDCTEMQHMLFECLNYLLCSIGVILGVVCSQNDFLKNKGYILINYLESKN